MAEPPTGTDTRQLTTQVGGHAGIETMEDESLLIKPALRREIEFYEELARADVESEEEMDSMMGRLVRLREYVPRFIGVLRLEGKLAGEVGEDGGMKIEPSIVLENLTYGFLKPNVLDIKLGRELYDSEASAEKVERMKRVARATTSWETGIRLTGFQVYDNITGEAVNTPKSYGKSIKPCELSEGIARFFPVGDEEGSRSGLPREALVKVLEGIKEEVEEIREIFGELEVRMVGASLLMIYESDWERASENGFVVKVIDFAHTTLGNGRDDGVIVGLDSTIRLITERVNMVRARSK